MGRVGKVIGQLRVGNAEGSVSIAAVAQKVGSGSVEAVGGEGADWMKQAAAAAAEAAQVLRGGVRRRPVLRHVAAAAADRSAPAGVGRGQAGRRRLREGWRVLSRAAAAGVRAHLRLRRPLPGTAQVLPHHLRRRRLLAARHQGQALHPPEGRRVPQPAAAQAVGVLQPLLAGRRLPRPAQVLPLRLRRLHLPAAQLRRRPDALLLTAPHTSLSPLKSFSPGKIQETPAADRKSRRSY